MIPCLIDHKKNFILFFISMAMLLFLWPDSGVYGSTIDWTSQHIVFPDYFRRLFQEEGTMFPSLALAYGGGQNLSQLAYYGWLRPDVLLSFAFPFIKMSTFISIAGILYVFLSVQLLYQWLCRHTTSNIAFFCSVLFLCAGPMLFHSHRHIMFISYFPGLLIALMGCDDWFQDKRYIKLLSGIFLMILSSYFYSVGGLLVLFIYAGSRIIEKKDSCKQYGKQMFQFLLLLFLGILLSAVLLLPVVLSTLAQPREALEEITWQHLFTLKNGLSALYYDTYNLGLTAMSGIAIFTCLFYGKRKQRFLACWVMLIFIFPIGQYILNGMQYVREKSLIPFLPLILLMMASFLQMLFEKKDQKKLLVAILVCSLQIFLFQAKETMLLFGVDMIILSILAFLAIKKHPKFIGFYVCVPIVLCFALSKTEQFAQKKDLEQPTKNEMINNVLRADQSLYRFDDLTGNQFANTIASTSMWRSSIYSSNSNQDYNTFYYDIMKAPASSTNHVIIPASYQPYVQGMMSVKYVYSTCDTMPEEYAVINKKASYCVGKNDNVLPIMYISNKIMSQKQFQTLSYPQTLETLYSYTIVERDIKDKELSTTSQAIPVSIQRKDEDPHLTIVKEGNDYHIKADKKTSMIASLAKPLKGQYVVISFQVVDIKEDAKVTIEMNHITNIKGAASEIYSADENTFTYILNGDELDHSNLVFSAGEYTCRNVSAWALDKKVLKQDKQIQGMPLTKGDSHLLLSTKTKVKEDGYLVTSFPYQQGFQIDIDDQKVPYERVNTAFVGAKIKKGEHTIQIRYEQPGQSLGLWISITVLLVLLLYQMNKKRQKGNPIIEDDE